MPISTWIRDVLGIRKDIVDTKKTELEIEKLRDERRARSLITPATLDDVKKYDPKREDLLRTLRQAGSSHSLITSPLALVVAILILLAVIAVWLLYPR